MKAIVALIAILAALGLAVFLFYFTAKTPPAEAAAQAPSELVELRAELKALAERVDAMQQATHLDSGGGARLSQSDVDAAVERALATRAPADSAPAADKGSSVPAKLDAAGAYAQLMDPALDFDGRRRKWTEFAKAGLMDEVLALYEKEAAANPNDPKAQTALGQAYLNKLFNSPQGPESGIWGTKADKSFDRALALDDHNWEARFVKAISLSNWPAFLGKQPEAIANLEILVQQQSQGELKAHYAQTYLILGNLYQQTGKADKALAMWQQGQALFPADADLQKQIQIAQQH